MGIPDRSTLIVDLNSGQYQASITAFRNLLESTDGTKIPFFRISVRTPNDEYVDVQIRSLNAYLVGFRGADKWYAFDGEVGGWGESCGTGSNYNDLGKVGRISYDDLRAVGKLARFKKGRDPLDKRIIAVLIALLCEAARFATVSTYFTGLTNAVGTEHSGALMSAMGNSSIDFEYLKSSYFTKWENPPSSELEVGKLYHHQPSDHLFKHRK
jgi:hypothetical protein